MIGGISNFFLDSNVVRLACEAYGDNWQETYIDTLKGLSNRLLNGEKLVVIFSEFLRYFSEGRYGVEVLDSVDRTIVEYIKDSIDAFGLEDVLQEDLCPECAKIIKYFPSYITLSHFGYDVCNLGVKD